MVKVKEEVSGRFLLTSFDIDLEEQLVAAWFVPFDEGANGWSAEPLYNVQNIIWSGLM